ncbi:50S ribosomal protein L2 [Candidatus Dojkabacteria bacterium]|uniref:50S ribosomal protein L2 n=1 Tax=Candidatus Dojkabacteria bacterium TaxID=2099670 RepID=A0A955LBX3_9BACT|nr:50S ribosomal protein L2 [Candidatus Dojkabacteria bacterium]
MALKKFKATSPGIRHAVLIDRSDLSKEGPHKSLTRKIKRNVGRNNRGVITTRHKSAGVKKLYRQIDFKRDKKDVPAIIESVEYDPNRTAFISLVKYADGERRYILSPDDTKVGDEIISSEEAPIRPGNSMPLKRIPQGTYVHSVELRPGAGATIGRSAGTSIQVMGGDKGYIQLKMPSGEYRLVKEDSYATIGTVSNPDQKNVKYGKAGRKRKKGIRPSVRGVAMSYKHPHGGGQGKSGRHGTGGPAKDRWGNKIGKRTRRDRKVSSKFIVRRRPSKNKFKKYKTVI